MNCDLTIGKPDKVLWKFCLPLFGSMIFQQLYNIADSFVAGKFIGEHALAAVGNSYEITLIFIAFAFGCNIGCSVITSRYFGAKQYKEMKTAITTSFISALVVCMALMLLGLFYGDTMLTLIRTPDILFEDSNLYLAIYTVGLPFVFFYNISTGIFSALGDSKTPFIFLSISSVSNIVVDILFVKEFQLGISGVAWATFLCQGISCVLSLIVLARRLYCIKTEKAPLFSKKVFGQFAQIAIPSILQQSFISIGNIIIQGVINSFGPGVMAGYSAGVKLNNLVITSFITLGNGISNYTSQNLGAGKYDRIGEGFKSGWKMVWILCVPICLFYMLLPETLLSLFLDSPSADALKSGVQFLRILTPFYFIVSLKLVSDGILRGSSLMKQFMTGTLTDLILRVVLAILFSSTILGFTGIWCAWPIGWTVSTIISIYFSKKASSFLH